jgi:hypothetical protein
VEETAVHDFFARDESLVHHEEQRRGTHFIRSSLMEIGVVLTRSRGVSQHFHPNTFFFSHFSFTNEVLLAHHSGQERGKVSRETSCGLLAAHALSVTATIVATMIESGRLTRWCMAFSLV